MILKIEFKNGKVIISSIIRFGFKNLSRGAIDYELLRHGLCICQDLENIKKINVYFYGQNIYNWEDKDDSAGSSALQIKPDGGLKFDGAGQL